MVAVSFGPATAAVAASGAAGTLGPGEAGGTVNAHYGRDPIVKIYTTITDRYAPLHQKVIAGTAGEAIHALDGILGHESNVNVAALHVDGGGVSDIVFAVLHLLGLSFEPAFRACRIASSMHSNRKRDTADWRPCSDSASMPG
jgi:TnpA family transposase